MSREIDFSHLPDNHTAADILDIALNRACLDYAEADKGFFIGTSHIIDMNAVQQADIALMGLIFFADARAIADKPLRLPEPELAWVPVAKTAIKRMSYVDKMLRGLNETYLFDDAHHSIQRKAYREMVALRGPNDRFFMPFRGGDYAMHVAMSEIVLYDSSQTSLN